LYDYLIGVSLHELDSGGIIRYQVGQQFKEHPDGGADEDDTYYRPVSFLIYLNDMAISDGGGTSFPKIARTVQPKRGMAVMWSNYIWDRQQKKNIRDKR
jgi:hypothetical protein